MPDPDAIAALLAFAESYDEDDHPHASNALKERLRITLAQPAEPAEGPWLGPEYAAALGEHLGQTAAPAEGLARQYLTPMEHLPARMVGDPDDIPRCVACRILLTPRDNHRDDCPVDAYLAALAETAPPAEGLRTLFEAVESDPLVVAWRAFSDRFMDPEYRDDPKRMHIREAFAAGWDAALAQPIDPDAYSVMALRTAGAILRKRGGYGWTDAVAIIETALRDVGVSR
jgi:predicted secreted protein